MRNSEETISKCMFRASIDPCRSKADRRRCDADRIAPPEMIKQALTDQAQLFSCLRQVNQESSHGSSCWDQRLWSDRSSRVSRVGSASLGLRGGGHQ